MRYLEVKGHRTDGATNTTCGADNDYKLAAFVDGQHYADCLITIKRNGLSLTKASVDQYHRFCTSVTGLPSQRWIEITRSLDKFRSIGFDRWEHNELNLLRALNLIYLWVEPTLVLERPTPELRLLYDEVIINYTGQPGPQPYIYFLSRDAHAASSDALDQLYRLKLTGKISLSLSGTIDRRFVPLALPAVRREQFTVESFRLWQEIRREMGYAIRGLVEGQS